MKYIKLSFLRLFFCGLFLISASYGYSQNYRYKEINQSKDYSVYSEFAEGNVTATKTIDIKWPEYVDGLTHRGLSNLRNSITQTLFGKDYSSLKLALNDFFMVSDTTEIPIIGMSGPTERAEVGLPIENTARILRIPITQVYDAGCGSGACYFVTYTDLLFDKNEGKVVTPSMVFIPDLNEEQLVSLVNDQIQRLNQDGEDYGMARKKPVSYEFPPEGLVCVYDLSDHVIKFTFQGNQVRIIIPYRYLKEYLSPYFIKLRGIK